MAKLPVHELRRLDLPIETAVDAALELDAEQGGSLAHGTLVGAHIEAEGAEPGLLVVVRRAGIAAPEQRKFTLPVLAAAFIRYCWKCRIPLPRSGAKRIEIAPRGFVFTIEGTTEVLRRHGPLPAGRPPKAAADDPTPREDSPPEATAASGSMAALQSPEASESAAVG